MPDTDPLLTNLENAAAKSAGAYPNIKSVVKLFFVFILYTIAVGIPAGIISISIPNNAPLLRSLLGFVVYVISLLLVINYTLKRVYTFSINFNKIQGWLVPVIIIGTLALVIPLWRIAGLLPMPEFVRRFFERGFTNNFFSIATAVIAAPLLEEILCRGIILRGLLKNYAPGKAIIISAIFFAAVHLNPWQGIVAFFSGLFMGWLYFKTHSVIPGMIVHVTINTAATLFLLLPTYQRNLLSPGALFYLIILLASVIVFTIACFVIHKKAVVIPKPVIISN